MDSRTKKINELRGKLKSSREFVRNLVMDVIEQGMDPRTKLVRDGINSLRETKESK